MSIKNHTPFMERALRLAARGRGRTSPNPMVGAVIVKGNRIIAEGYHKKAGTAHAEVIALKKAGAQSRGATLYINLEPCCHTDKKTPPCTGAIIQQGIRKVVAAMKDPNPKVSGKGLLVLRKAGIQTEVGLMKAEAERLNEAFVKFIKKREPFVILKIAQSLDGKIATATGESQWITGEKARELVQRMRNEVDAVLVGIGTVMKDNPSLDCRMRRGKNPYRIIVDSRLRIPLRSRVLEHRDNRTILATTGRASRRKAGGLENRGHTVLFIRERNGDVDLKVLMRELGKQGVTSLMIEGGSSINASALKDRVADKVIFFLAPKIIGGVDSIPSIGGMSPPLLHKAVRMRDLRVSPVGEDILMECYPLYQP